MTITKEQVLDAVSRAIHADGSKYDGAAEELMGPRPTSKEAGYAEVAALVGQVFEMLANLPAPPPAVPTANGVMLGRVRCRVGSIDDDWCVQFIDANKEVLWAIVDRTINRGSVRFAESRGLEVEIVLAFSRDQGVLGSSHVVEATIPGLEERLVGSGERWTEWFRTSLPLSHNFEVMALSKGKEESSG